MPCSRGTHHSAPRAMRREAPPAPTSTPCPRSRKGPAARAQTTGGRSQPMSCRPSPRTPMPAGSTRAVPSPDARSPRTRRPRRPAASTDARPTRATPRTPSRAAAAAAGPSRPTPPPTRRTPCCRTAPRRARSRRARRTQPAPRSERP
eukprot:scaffold57196_cov83-Phaeocystis_antarctica.AAC.1